MGVDFSKLIFDQFKLDPADAQFWYAEQKLTLRAQSFAVLRFLAEHPDHLISREKLMREVSRGDTGGDIDDADTF
jgi:DNA-binding response OmpR family regulator